MKTKFFIPMVIICLGLPMLSSAEEKVGNTEWKVRMQAMLTDVLKLIPYAFDEKKFNNEKNHAEIEKSLGDLAAHSTALKAHTAKFKAISNSKIDPSLRFIAEAFENEVGAAKISFAGSADDRHQAQMYLRSAVSKCTACHSQSSNGPQLKLEDLNARFTELAPSDRYLALVATRQFDAALTEFSKSLRTPKISGGDELAVDRTAKSAIAIAVRVKRDPKLARQLIQELETSGLASKMLQADLPDWKSAVDEWQKAKPINSLRESDVFQEATRLLVAGKKRDTGLGRYQNSDVTMLRATTLLHDLLSNFPQSKQRGEIYLLLADAYDHLPGFTVWDLPDEYLAACIQENPHTVMSEKCFEKYRASIVMGYSGSSGTHVPAAVQQHVDRMKVLSRRTTQAQ